MGPRVWGRIGHRRGCNKVRRCYLYNLVMGNLRLCVVHLCLKQSNIHVWLQIMCLRCWAFFLPPRCSTSLEADETGEDTRMSSLAYNAVRQGYAKMLSQEEECAKYFGWRTYWLW